ncbi:nicotinate-nucleotide adenylyltransferase [Alloiococcus sp. CFN-8]|uniref:nicotinate-nucleotide adenylyltransferase n=1 Tax=Alloiococcus sp. CFN-8 TaxID=3416081 RepID=UPI003CF59611
MKNIGILGGTFNPIHNGHLYIASEAMEELSLSEVLFIPAGNPPHKSDSAILEASIRGDMTKAAIKDYQGFTYCDYEINKKSYSYTYETLQYLNSKYTNTKFHFIVGADSLLNLHKWKNVPEILRLARLVVFMRPGSSREELEEVKKNTEENYGTEIIFLELLQMDISSSDIRKRIQEKRNYKFLVPEEVFNYIEANDLYR